MSCYGNWISGFHCSNLECGHHPHEGSAALWKDVGSVQDSQSSVKGCLHVTPLWVDVMKEVGEQTCGGPLMLDVPSGSVTKRYGVRPIQWTVRRKEEDQPSGSDA